MSGAVVRIDSPGALLATLPYMLGFHPERSIVAVCFDHGGRHVAVLRIDLPDPGEVLHWVSTVAGLVQRTAAPAVILVGYENITAEASEALQHGAAALRNEGLSLLDVLVVREGRWWSKHCTEPLCCPPQGQPIPVASSVPAVAEFVGRGVAPMQSRDSLADTLAPNARATEVLAWAAQNDFSGGNRDSSGADRRAREVAVWATVLSAEGAAEVARLPVEVLGIAAESLLDSNFRDALIARLTMGALGTCSGQDLQELDTEVEFSSRIQECLTGLCASLPPSLAGPALCVLGGYAWARGNGCLAGLATDRALEVAPEYRLAALLGRVVREGIKPRPRR